MNAPIQNPIWILTVRSPEGEPHEYHLQPGKNLIGRKLTNDIIIHDLAASRIHAEIEYEPQQDQVLIRDLGSTNGTFLNRNRLEDVEQVKERDVVRIGMCLIHFQKFTEKSGKMPRATDTRPLTRELVLESFDRHSVLLYEVARQLNTVLDTEMTLEKMTGLMKQSMGAEHCAVVLPEQFNHLDQVPFPSKIIEMAIHKRNAVVIPDISLESDSEVRGRAADLNIRSALCIPIMSSDVSLLGVIYLYKTSIHSRPFDSQDIQLAVAIGHMAALTLERVSLLEKIREEQTVRQLLQRFVAPSEVEEFWQDYLQNGGLPGLVRQDITVLFTDIVDSTSLAEKLGTQQFGDLLSRYYSEMTEVIFKHGGLINKYLGDGILAIFGIGKKGTEPELSAIRAGLELIDIASNSHYPDIVNFSIGVGINTGPVMAGYVGAKERVEFSVVGDTVNVASRLEELSKPNRIFIGPITRAAIQNEFESVRIGEMSIRGRSATMHVYQVIVD